MLKDLKITSKLPLVMITFALISAIVTGIIAYLNASNGIKLVAQEKLLSLLESRKASLDNYFSTIEKDLNFNTQSPLIIGAIEDFSKAWLILPNNKLEYLQELYIHNNPFSLGQKDAFLTANDNSLYNELHSYYHPIFRNLIAARSYHDLFLFDHQGNLIYTVKKELDFASSSTKGKWKNTHLVQAFNTINKNPILGKHVFVDFAPYEPSNNGPASFIASPVFDQNKNYIGVLAFQLSIDTLNRVMQVTAGMGESGETYLVGSDLLMRSDSRFYKERSVLQSEVDTSSVHSALKGEIGASVIYDYRNVKVFSAYGPINFLNTRWAIIAEIDESEVLKPVYTMSYFLLTSGVVITILICFFGYLLAFDISHPIVAMTNMMARLAENKLNTNISVSDRKDEVGGMAKAMVVFKQNAIERDQLQQKLSHAANHDIVTGLPSRKFALERLNNFLDESKKINLTLMFIDLDNFKLVNDTMGHHVGDQLLKDVAERLSICVRKEDIVARMGGDEFIIILPDVYVKEDIQKTTDKVLEALNIEFSTLKGQNKVTASIGIAIYPQHANDSFTLIKQADRAMYNAKGKGKNKYCYPDKSEMGWI